MNKKILQLLSIRLVEAEAAYIAVMEVIGEESIRFDTIENRNNLTMLLKRANKYKRNMIYYKRLIKKYNRKINRENK